MSSYVLIHGSWHGAWVWEGVARALTDAGHSAAMPDLPGRGEDQRDPSTITLTDHVDRVIEVVGSFGRPVILVGHSFGGLVISHVAERAPERIGLLVYVGAFLLRSGETVLGRGGVPTDVPYLEVREADGLVVVRPHVARHVFYDDCPVPDAERAERLLVPEALAPRRTPAELTEANFGRVPRVYVETVNDRALPVSLQRRMHAALPCREVVSLGSGHSPFLSMPAALAEHLLAWGERGRYPAPTDGSKEHRRRESGTWIRE